MLMENQQRALETLRVLANGDQHRILISGPSGCGKTHIAREYSKMLRISDFYQVSSVMSDVKSIIDLCSDMTNRIVLCIENLDAGMLQVTNPLLKFIEDCPEHLYVIVTCRNLRMVPDTIISRCTTVSLNNPTKKDIEQYAAQVNSDQYNILRVRPIWNCIDTFSDVDDILALTGDQLSYIDRLSSILDFKSSVSNITWKLQNFEDRTPTPIVIVLKYIMTLIMSAHGKKLCLDCLNGLTNSRMGQNAVITKFVFDSKYAGGF